MSMLLGGGRGRFPKGVNIQAGHVARWTDGRMDGMNGYSVECAEIVPVTFIKNSMNTNFALRDVLKLSD